MTSENPPAFERRLDARLVMSVAATGLMSFSGVVIETAMNVTFPTLMAEFSVGTSTVQWMTTGYLLVLACVIPLSSFLKRRFPTKALFVCAMALFLTGVVVCALAPSFDVLLAGRLVQGVGTGVALPLMFNIVLEQSPLDRMGSMMGVASLITAAAPAVGRILDRFGARPPILLGNALIVCAAFLFAIVGASLSTPWFLGIYLVFGLGQGLSVGNMMTNGLSRLGPELTPDGNAAINTLQQLAGAVGTALAAGMVSAGQAASVRDVALGTAGGTCGALWVLLGSACLMAASQVACLRDGDATAVRP
ncbi:MAG: MFS transporter [Atopobiaceae bacterium]|jgi:MFS family permease|nr:MFS transporter [Atopobiaceae bacterium]